MILKHRKKRTLKKAQNNKIVNVAGSVSLSLFMVVVENAKLSSKSSKSMRKWLEETYLNRC